MAGLRRTNATPAVADVVAVTGAATGLGQALFDRLLERSRPYGPEVRLIGIDTAEQPARAGAAAEWRTADPRDPLLEAPLEGATTVVHLATSYDVTEPSVSRRTLNVRGTERVLAAAAAVGVRRVVLVTSADVWGARPDNPVPLPDRAPLRALPDEQTLAGDHVRIEQLAASAGVPVTVLRPATLVGGRLGPAYDGQLLRQLQAARLLAVRGREPQWQLCHSDDLLSALELAATGAVVGALGVACEGALPQARVEVLAGRHRLELPVGVAISTAERLHRLGLTASSPRELDHLLGPLVLAADGLQAARWRPSWTNEAALRDHLDGRPGDSHAGAYTAAGATLGLLGSAALVRRARRRRRSR